MIKREIQIFFTALMFYTRIPCPKWVNHDPDYLNQSTRYFPLIGWIVGGVSWLVFVACHYFLSIEISILLSMVGGILITGAFHEDGFADVCDGFGGGWTKEKILLIMKDSRVGAYGVVGIILIFLLKFYCLQELGAFEIYQLSLILITAHALSRLTAVCIIFTSTYVRDDADSKAKPIAKELSTANLIIATGWVLIPFMMLIFINVMYVVILIPVGLITCYLRWYYCKWINGYTGDCLGATQQVNEVVIYLSMLAIWKFT